MSAAFSEGPPRRLDDRGNHGLMVIGRLRPDITEAHATARLAALSTQLAQAYPAENRDQALVLHSLSRLSLGTHPQDDSDEAVASTLLLAMSGVVLVIASMNLANMLLARGSMRRKEFAVRLAIGGSRVRVIRQLLTEGLLLSVLGGIAGLVLAFWATRLLVVSLVPIMPLLLTFDPRPDVRVLGATVAFAVASTILASLGPAWRLSRPDLVPDLKAQGHQDRVRRGWRALASPRHVLVVGQVALSLVLLTAGGLFLRGALQAAASDPGFRLDRGLVLGLDPTLAGYDPAKPRRRTGTCSRACDRSAGSSRRVWPRSCRSASSPTCAMSRRRVPVRPGVTTQWARITSSSAPTTSRRWDCRCCGDAGSRGRRKRVGGACAPS